MSLLDKLRLGQRSSRNQRDTLPPGVSQAIREFQGRRHAYLDLLADQLERIGGRVNYMELFSREASRYYGTGRGKLAAFWIDCMEGRGARLAEIWKESFPPDELAIISVAELRGKDSTIAALRNIARVGVAISVSQSEFLKTAAVGVIAVGLACSTLLAMPLFFKPLFMDIYSMVPPDLYGPLTKRFFAISDFIKYSAPFIGVGLLAILMWIRWALPNWVGERRTWADDKIGLFKAYRQFKGSLFLATFASLTSSNGSDVTNQRNALKLMASQLTPWLRSKVTLMLRKIDETGAKDAELFDVGVVDKETFYLISDLVDARGLGEGLGQAGRESEKRVVATIREKGNVVRWILLGGSLITVFSIVGSVYGLMFEFKAAIQVWTSA